MHLKSVHTYQYVRFQGANENFLSIDSVKFPNLKITLRSEGVVDVKSDKDHILIFPTNIAYCVPMTPETMNKNESRGQIKDTKPEMFRK